MWSWVEHHLHGLDTVAIFQPPRGCSQPACIGHRHHAANKRKRNMFSDKIRPTQPPSTLFHQLTAAQNWVRPRATFSQPGWEHFFPPPCFTQYFVDDCADLSQPSTVQRRPPPCAVHRLEPPTADLLHPSNLQRFPPP